MKICFSSGWLYQIRNTVAPGSFLFDSKAFPDTPSELKKLDVGTLFNDEKYHWPKGGLLSDRYGTFINKLINSDLRMNKKLILRRKNS
ncbi:MAG: hypothetical protein IPP27_02495 [Bacteroidetes bacterium]|nr:hypothetical protein [Bacteroidota bacterium]